MQGQSGKQEVSTTGINRKPQPQGFVAMAGKPCCPLRPENQSSREGTSWLIGKQKRSQILKETAAAVL